MEIIHQLELKRQCLDCGKYFLGAGKYWMYQSCNQCRTAQIDAWERSDYYRDKISKIH